MNTSTPEFNSPDADSPDDEKDSAEAERLSRIKPDSLLESEVDKANARNATRAKKLQADEDLAKAQKVPDSALLRSVIDYPDSLSQEQLLNNWEKLEGAKVSFLGSNHKIYAFLSAFYAQHGEMPQAATVAAHFEQLKDVETVDRINVIEKLTPYIRTNYSHQLTRVLEAQVKVKQQQAAATVSKAVEEGKPVDLVAFTAAFTESAPAVPAPWEARVRVVPDEWATVAPPPRRWLLRDTRNSNEGVMPLGKVGLLAAEGGSGKTMAGIELALAVATGGQWLDTFSVPAAGKVLLILGEEDDEEAWRRIERCARSANVSNFGGALQTLTCAGLMCPMIDQDDAEAPFLIWLREYLKTTGPYALVVLDPLARFSGADTEKDNHAATHFVTTLESLIEPSGGATILGMHHTSQASRARGADAQASAARGVTGLPDAVRWVSVMQVDRVDHDGTVQREITLSVVKSNYAMIPAPVVLRAGDGGVLVPATEGERTATQVAREQSDPRARRVQARDADSAAENTRMDAAVIESIRQNHGISANDLRDQIKARAACGTDKADVAVARVLNAGHITRTKAGRSWSFSISEGTAPSRFERAEVLPPQNDNTTLEDIMAKV